MTAGRSGRTGHFSFSPWASGAVSCALMAALAIPLSARAQTVPEEAASTGKWPQVTLNADASAEVAQDMVQITLAAEVSDGSQSKVTAKLSKALKSAMDQAKAETRVKARSGNYRIWPNMGKDGKISAWQGRGEIILESSDFAAASDLANALADRTPIAGLAFSVSREARLKVEQELLTQAVAAFQERARTVSAAFGYGSYELRGVDVGGGGVRPFAPAARMMMAEAKDAVPLEGGTERVTVSVQGSIFLRDKK